MTKRLTISHLRFWIAQTLKKVFDIDWNELPKCVFLVHNLIKYPVQLTLKNYHNKKKLQTKIVEQKWMNEVNLQKIWNILLNRNKEYVLQQNKFCKIDSNANDTWIEWTNFENKCLSNDSRIVDLMQQYKKIKNIDIAQALIGGTRKFISAKIKTAEKYFNKNFHNKIMRVYNTNNFTHNNQEGEECCNKNNDIKKKYINEELKKYSKEDLFEVCDYLVKFLDIFFAMLKLGDIPK